MRRLLVLTVSMISAGCPGTTSAPTAATEPAKPMTTTTTTEAGSSNTATEITITDPSQREAAVGKPVVVVGVQTRTKQPTVNGVDVDGDYKLSDREVVARGILEKHVVPEEPPSKDGLQVASRGAGTFYSVVDPATGRLAQTRAK